MRRGRFELRFVSDSADQRMMEGVLGLRGEPDLIDQLGPQQFVECWINVQID
jgi:hypothetical protein